MNNTRFACKCRPGYQGRHCDQPITSCHGHINRIKPKATRKGFYFIIDNDNKPFLVHCRYSWSNRKRAWTLIQSYKSNQRDSFEASSNSANPNDVPYRMLYSRVKSIRQNSTEWRIRQGEYKNGPWNVTFISIDAPNRKCTSCTRKGTNKCKLSDYEMYNCTDEHAVEELITMDCPVASNPHFLIHPIQVLLVKYGLGKNTLFKRHRAGNSSVKSRYNICMELIEGRKKAWKKRQN